LAPLIRAEIWQCLTRLKSAGQSILVIDKNVEALIRIADRHYVIERGRVVWTGSSAELKAAPSIQHRYLGV
jgi:branched-chain amino acid transport system ATP-binding protein